MNILTLVRTVRRFYSYVYEAFNTIRGVVANLLFTKFPDDCCGAIVDEGQGSAYDADDTVGQQRQGCTAADGQGRHRSCDASRRAANKEVFYRTSSIRSSRYRSRCAGLGGSAKVAAVEDDAVEVAGTCKAVPFARRNLLQSRWRRRWLRKSSH